MTDATSDIFAIRNGSTVTINRYRVWEGTLELVNSNSGSQPGGPGPSVQPPAAPASLRSTNTGSTSVSLAWNAAAVPAGSPAVTEYRVYESGSQVRAVGNTLSTTLTGLTAATEYNFTVRAYNGALSPVSNTVTLTTTNPADPAPSGWTLKAETDFTYASLAAMEADGWTIYDGQTQSNDLSINLRKNVKVGAGGLTIEGHRESGYSRAFTSGEIVGRTAKWVVPNYFRCRVEGYHALDSGFWPALLWFRPQAGGDGSNGEIDVHEYFGGAFSGTNRRIAITMHPEYSSTDKLKNPILYTQLANSSITAPHTYTMEKTPGYMRVWIDDDPVNQVRYFGPNAPNHGPGALFNGIPTRTWWNRIMEASDRTWYPRITLQIGGNVPTPDPSWTFGTMHVTKLQFWTQT